MEGKPSYWKNTGLHQKELDDLRDMLEKQVASVEKYDWSAKENRPWALLNASLGLWYGWYNDGNLAEGAVDNNRTHGFSTVDKLKRLAEKTEAHQLLNYLEVKSYYTESMVKARLEKMMDEAISIVWRCVSKKE